MERPSKDHWGKDKNAPLELFVAEDVRPWALAVTMLRGVRKTQCYCFNGGWYSNYVFSFLSRHRNMHDHRWKIGLLPGRVREGFLREIFMTILTLIYIELPAQL